MIYNSNSDGKNYKALRKQMNLTQEEVAKRLNVKQNSVSRWERGVSIPDQSILPKIAELYGTTVDYLLTGKEPTEPNTYFQTLYNELDDTYKEMAISALEGIYIASKGPIPHSIKESKEKGLS